MNMAEIWFDKYMKLKREKNVADSAPALFTPEYVKQLNKDIDNAAENVEFWRNYS